MTAPTQAQFQRTFYRWGGDSRLGNGAGPGLWPVSSSLASRAALRSWHRRIEPWLRTAPGNAPAPNHFYGAFGSEAIMIRREQTADPESATAQLLIGPAEFLTPADALELRDWQWRPASRSTGLAPLDLARLDVHRSDLRARAGSAPVAKRLGPLLSQALAGPAAVLSPLSQYAEPLLWGIQEIIGVLFEGLTEEQRWPLSFVTHDDRPRSQEQPGLFIRFRDDAPRVTAHPVYGALAGRLVTEYVRHGINGLRALTAEPALQSLGPQARIDLLLHQLSGEPVPRRPSTPGERVTPTETSRTPTGGGKQVSCPICLEKLSWDDLPLYRYDLDLDRYVELTIPEDASEEHQAREMRTAAVRCPNPGAQVHFLPAAYGQFGPPAVYGFIGATRSGKTHVLASMVAAIERGDLSRYGLAARPIDLNRHQRFLRESVRPLSSGGRQLAATSEGVVSFVDGFLISGAGPERPVALFDVAGEELGDVDNAKHFLDLADGLIFVVDPTQIGRDSLGDRTFSTVLNLLRASGRLSKVSAAIVLNKADLVRFEEPIAYWLRHDDDRLDAAASLRESADVYAYLHQKGAAAWTRPYQECPRVTLHVASATGSSSSEKATTGLHSFERGVQSRRVLRPLVSLMAMTGIIIDDEARKVGI